MHQNLGDISSPDKIDFRGPWGSGEGKIHNYHVDQVRLSEGVDSEAELAKELKRKGAGGVVSCWEILQWILMKIKMKGVLVPSY